VTWPLARLDFMLTIERGDHPSWTLHMQIMPFDEAKTYRFNPFDLTKVWPHGDFHKFAASKKTVNKASSRWSPRTARSMSAYAAR
jgi:catalase